MEFALSGVGEGAVHDPMFSEDDNHFLVANDRQINGKGRRLALETIQRE